MIRISKYIHELVDWPRLIYRSEALFESLVSVSRKQGTLLGRAEELGFDFQNEATLDILTENVVQTSAIEGENLDVAMVRSSVARRLGIDTCLYLPEDRNIEGIVEVTLNATRLYSEPLTRERLWTWHRWLFPMGYGPMGLIDVGKWRSGSMRVASMRRGQEVVHFEAPEAARLDREMELFLTWFNDANTDVNPILRSAIAHLWFITIHPFDDGNGRIARAIGDMLLAQSDDIPFRFYSLSSQIQRERKTYYDVLEQTQKGTLDVTEWVEWYLTCLDHALDNSSLLLEGVLRKARFWRIHAGENLHPSQKKILNRLLDGFEGKMTAQKWAHITGQSRATVLREINDLIERRIIQSEGGGRSTSYRLPDG